MRKQPFLESVRMDKDPVIQSVEKRIAFIESKLFQIMAQNDELLTKVQSLEKIIINKEEQMDTMDKHARNQDANMKCLKSMFINILEESENLAFCLSLVEQKERDDAENIRFGSEFQQKVSSIVGLRPYGQHFLWDMNNTKWCNGFHIQFRQTFAKETFSYDEHLKS